MRTKQNDDMTEAGTISFCIRTDENPMFTDPESNISFAQDKDVGGARISIVKKGAHLKVSIENLKYGETTMLTNIEGLLDEDMKVALTWDKREVKLYLNGDLAEESQLTERDAKIKTSITDEALEIMESVDITEDHVLETVNHRDRGILIPGSPIRMGAVHWFKDKIVFVNTLVSKSRMFGNKLKLDEVNANLVLRLADDLPAGSINRGMNFVDILRVVANSFGLPVATAEGGEEKTLHIEGEWDGTVAISSSEQPFLIQGTFSGDEDMCHYVWAFSPAKYMKWAKEQNIA